MADRLTLTSVEAAGVKSAESTGGDVPHVPHEVIAASMQQALDAVTSISNSYSLQSLEQREELLIERRRMIALSALEAEDDVLAEDTFIDREVTAGAHLDELHAVIEELQDGTLMMSQNLVDDVVNLMVELRGIMPELPEHLVSEIKSVARPLRQAITDFQNRIEVV